MLLSTYDHSNNQLSTKRDSSRVAGSDQQSQDQTQSQLIKQEIEEEMGDLLIESPNTVTVCGYPSADRERGVEQRGPRHEPSREPQSYLAQRLLPRTTEVVGRGGEHVPGP